MLLLLLLELRGMTAAEVEVARFPEPNRSLGRLMAELPVPAGEEALDVDDQAVIDRYGLPD